MRIGLIGAGPHRRLPRADPVTDCRRSTSLVVTDAVPGRRATGRGAVRRRGRADARRACSPRASTASSSPPPTDAHPDLILAARRAGIPMFCEKPRRRPGRRRPSRCATARGQRRRRSRSATRAGSTPPSAAARADVAAASSAACTPCGRRRWTRRRRRRRTSRGSGGIFRDCAIHDFDAVRWVTGQEVVEVYAAGTNQGVDYIEAGRRRRVRHRASSPSTTAPSPSSPTAVTTPAATTSAWSCTAARTASRRAWTTACRCARPSPGVTFPARHAVATSSWTASPDAFRAELAAFTEVVAGNRPSPCTIDDGARGVARSPRPPRAPGRAPAGARRRGPLTQKGRRSRPPQVHP